MAHNQASIDKVFYHTERLEEYLRGETIFPVSIDLHPTNICSRKCPGCPSGTRPLDSNMPLEKIEYIFDQLRGKTKGLYISGGGDPLLHKEFPQILKSAKENEFEQIVIITNGNKINQPEISDALLEYATAVRISLNCSDAEAYAQIFGVSKHLYNAVTQDAKELIHKRNSSGSQLEIGIGTLTTKNDIEGIQRFVEKGEELDVDWVHFRPYVNGWATEDLKTTASDKIYAELVRQQQINPNVIVSHDRYTTSAADLNFEKLHAGHFLAVITPNGDVYAGDETLDMDGYVLGNIFEFNSVQEYLDNSHRLELLNVSSQNYPFLEGLNRSMIMSSRIQKAITTGQIPVVEEIKHPHIL